MKNLLIKIDETLDYLNGLSTNENKLVLLTHVEQRDDYAHYVLTLASASDIEDVTNVQVKVRVSEPITGALKEARAKATSRLFTELLIPSYNLYVK